MSTRKTTTAAGAAATKVENAFTVASTAATNTAATATTVSKISPETISVVAKVEVTTPMAADIIADSIGAQASSNANISITALTTSTDSGALEPSEETAELNSTKDAAQAPNTKQQQLRITRNSPLHGNKKETQDSTEHNNSESEDGSNSSVKRSSTVQLIRGRKSLKEAKESRVSKDDGTATEQLPAPSSSPGQAKEVFEQQPKDVAAIVKDEKREAKEKDSKDSANNSAITNDVRQVGTTPTTTVAGATPTNRVTRKTIMAPTASSTLTSTRITRNRRPSTASANVSAMRPDTPPSTTITSVLPPPTNTRGRRAAAAKKMSPVPAALTLESASKRKRSEEEISATSEPGAKYIKLELKDEDDIESTNAEDDAASVASESLKIKQELIESDESATETTMVTTTSAAVTVATAAGAGMSRGRGRWGQRKPAGTPMPASPSTRSTRQSKVMSPSPPTSTTAMSNLGTAAAAVVASNTGEPKRRRVGSVTSVGSSSTVTRSSSQNLPRPGAGAASQAPDEDSKDSMASSMDCWTDGLLLASGNTGMAQFAKDLAKDMIDCEMEGAGEKVPATSEHVGHADDSPQKMSEALTSNIGDTGVADILTVDCAATNVCIVTTSAGAVPMPGKTIVTEKTPGHSRASNSSDNGRGSDKAASLSPELVAEGVSEISVKAFYKKPKFFENNLGIEEDPTLGEIVQLVSGGSTVNPAGDAKEIDVTDVTNAADEAEPKIIQTAVEADAKLDDFLSNDSVIERELLYLDSNGMKKSPALEDAVNPSTEHLSPLIVEEDELLQKEEVLVGDFQPIEKEVLAPEMSKHEADEEDDDMAEESETISMDNNASLQEDALADDREEEITEYKACKEAADVVNNEGVHAVATKIDKTARKEKTVTLNKECDKKQAKLNPEIEKRHSSKGDNPKTKDIVCEDELKMVEKKVKLEKVHGDTTIDRDTSAVVVTMEGCSIKGESSENKENMKIDAHTSFLKAASSDDESSSMDIDGVGDSLKSKKEEKNVLEVEQQIDSPKLEVTPLSTNSFTVVSPIDTSSVTAAQSSGKEDESEQSTEMSTWITLEGGNYDEETLRQKEQHLKNLGLLTHKAAERRRQEYIQSSAAAVEASRQQPSSGGKRSGKSTQQPASGPIAQEYTGTLKTVIKLNRHSNGGSTTGASTTNGTGMAIGAHSKGSSSQQQQRLDAGGVRRQSLKITFQKGRARGASGAGQHNAERNAVDQLAHDEEAYYTIQNENEGAQISTGIANKLLTSDNTTTRSTTHNITTMHDLSHLEGAVPQQDIVAAVGNVGGVTVATHSKKDEKEEILIPEKASSFKFHPGRLCEDQCFYCSGKFGLYDTPCHVGQIKSLERQEKILANEEKLTVDNCLCDACFRHVDRRANVPSYKKRLSAHAASLESTTVGGSVADGDQEGVAEGESESQASRKCLVPECANPAAHSLRRKCIRKSVKKFLLNFDVPTGSAYVWLCQAHYDTVIQCSGCVLCKRRLGKNHMYHITSDTDRLEKALSEMGIPVQLGIGTAVCKLCRYFANLLMKPPDSTKSQKAEFVKNYRKRLLQFHNIHDGSNDASDADEDDSNGTTNAINTMHPKTTQRKSMQRKTEKLEATHTQQLHSPGGSSGSSVECLADMGTKSVDNNVVLGGLESGQHSNLMDYDAPLASSDSNSCSSPARSPKQVSKLQAILQSTANAASSSASDNSGVGDISNVLRANPNISMRELFHGEEELGLHYKAPFGSSGSQRTPEGWTRVQTFLQYDEPTRRLWEELQKPYGNQSSFLRHLILLEKYYRNGDLVLSPHASSNATVYTQTVRQRLSSYDDGHCGGFLSGDKHLSIVQLHEMEEDERVASSEHSRQDGGLQCSGSSKPTNLSMQLRSRSVSVDKLTKQLCTNAVTITARSRETASVAKQLDVSPQKSLLKEALNISGNNNGGHNAALNMSGSSNSRSILKSNLLGINKSVEILPISAASTSPPTGSNQQQLAPVGKNTLIAVVGGGSTDNKQQKILEVANKLLDNHLEQQAAALSQSKQAAAAAAAAAVSGLLTSPPELVSLQRRASTSGTASGNAASSSSSLLPSNHGNKRPELLLKTGSGAAGTSQRNIPPNVVLLPDTLTPQERHQSKSWRPTLMPVEENQHLFNKGGPLYQTADGRRLPALVQVQSGGKPFLISIFDYNRMCILRREKLLRDQMLKSTKNRQELKQHQQTHHQQQQPQPQHQIQKQATAHTPNYNKNLQKQQLAQHQQQQLHNAATAQQQLMQLQQMMLMQKQQHHHHQQQQQHAVKAASEAARFQTSHRTASTSNAAAATSNTAISSFASPMVPLLASAMSNAGAMTSSSSKGAVSLNNASWLWNNFPDANQLLLNGGAAAAAAHQSAVKLPPQLLPKIGLGGGGGTGAAATITSKQQQQQQLLFDNKLMSKIPKSLTVIPQHKLMAGAAAAALGGSSASGVGGNGHKE